MFLLVAFLTGLTAVATQHPSEDVDQNRVEAPTPTSHFQPGVTAKPLYGRATSVKATTITDVEYVGGDGTYITSVGSICGYVTTDIRKSQCRERTLSNH